MIKIKDEVDLKELEKFGFEFNNGTGKYVFSVRYPAGNGGMEIIVKFWDRKIYVWSNTNCIKDEAFFGYNVRLNSSRIG